MIVFWELNSFWGNFKIFLHGEWNEKFGSLCEQLFCTSFGICFCVLAGCRKILFGIFTFYFILFLNLTFLLLLFYVWLGWHRFHELFGTGFLNRLIYWYWAWKPNFFIINWHRFHELLAQVSWIGWYIDIGLEMLKIIFQTDQTD